MCLADYLPLANGGADDSSGSSNDITANLRGFRVLRALRLIRLMKLLTGLRVIKRWEVKVAINYPALSLFKCISGMLLLSHWFACIWGLQTIFASSKLDTWLAGNAQICEGSLNITTNVEAIKCKSPGCAAPLDRARIGAVPCRLSLRRRRAPRPCLRRRRSLPPSATSASPS